MKKINVTDILFVFLFFIGIACESEISEEYSEQISEKVEKKLPQEGVIAQNGMVVSDHPLATQVGAEILKKGGNAIDASVATFFALAVVYPQAGNIGGGGFAVYRLKDGEVGTLDFREKAATAAHRDMFLDEKGEVQAKRSLAGHLAVGVPGSPDGMLKLHEKLGKLSWAEVLQPAIDLAEKGHKLTPKQVQQINRFQETFDTINHHKVHLVKDPEWKVDETIYFKDLAQTLIRLRDKKRAGFYDGKTADLIVQEMQKGKGLITKEDLQNYQSVWRKPLQVNYKNYQLISMPPPSSGGIVLGQLLLGIEEFPIREWGYRNTQTIHIMTELLRRAYADRATHLGDPDFVDIPMDMLLDKDYIVEQKEDIDFSVKTPSEAIKEGEVLSIESFETTHFSVVDKEGNAVAITTTLNGYFGSKVEVEGAGFFLNNEMDDFSMKPGYPNQFGLVGGEANAIAPQKRMLSSMTPTILEKDGQLFMILGSPGGSTIITSVFQTMLNVMEHDMNMQQAVNAYRFHHQWLPDNILIEPSVSELDSLVRLELEGMGHLLEDLPVMGKVNAILVRPDGKYEGAADIRRSEARAEGL